MRNIFSFLIILVLAVELQAQTAEFPKLKSNTVGLEGSQIMIDQGEVSVGDWFAYVYHKALLSEDGILTEDVPSLAPFLPDTLLLPQKYRFMIKIFYRWIEPGGKNKQYSRDFFWGNNIVRGMVMSNDREFDLLFTKEEVKNGMRHTLETYCSLPIVGITYKQATAYLEWREEMINMEKEVLAKGYIFRARMLTQEEWIKYAADFGPHFPENKTLQIDTINKEGCYMLNIMVDKPCASVLEGRKKFGDGSVGVFSYNPDKFGLYNIYGNVSEMTNTEGVAMGGSYNDYGVVCKSDKTISYSKPQPWLGFRCVFEIVK